MSKNKELHKYIIGIKNYIKQIRTIYRLGVCIPAILSPLTLLPHISKLYLAFGGGSVFFLLLLIHYNLKAKMICFKLIAIAILNTLISLSIIYDLLNIQHYLCFTTCLLSTYVILEDKIKTALK